MSASSESARRPKLTVELLEDRTVPTFGTRAGLPSPAFVNGQAFPTTGGGESIAIGDVFPGNISGFFSSQYVIGTGPGTQAQVSVYDVNGNLLSQFVPFLGFKGGINVAAGDVLGLGSAQIIVTEATGGIPIVGVFAGNGTMLDAFFVDGNTTFSGGLNVAVGHVLGGIGTGRNNNTQQFPDQIILGTANDLPAVVVTDGHGNTLQQFFAFNPFSGIGVTVASADVDTMPTPGSGGGFGFGGGGGRVPDTNAYDEIIVGAASQIPAIGVFDVWSGSVVQREMFFAFNPSNNNEGVTVAAGDTAGIAGAQIYVSLVGSSEVRAFEGVDGEMLADFTVFPKSYSAVVNMAVGNVVNPVDPNSNANGAFDTNDLAVVAGDGPYFQQPRLYYGAFPGSPGPIAGENGP